MQLKTCVWYSSEIHQHMFYMCKTTCRLTKVMQLHLVFIFIYLFIYLFFFLLFFLTCTDWESWSRNKCKATCFFFLLLLLLLFLFIYLLLLFFFIYLFFYYNYGSHTWKKNTRQTLTTFTWCLHHIWEDIAATGVLTVDTSWVPTRDLLVWCVP